MAKKDTSTKVAEYAKTAPPEVIDALNGVYRPVLTAFEQFHRQEHRFLVKYHYKKLVSRWDKLVHCARCWRRCVLDRIERLGGDADSVMGPVSVEDDVLKAHQETHGLLSEIDSAITKAIAVVQSANDHPSHKLLMMLQKEVDHKMSKIEAHIRQIDDLGTNFLITAV